MNPRTSPISHVCWALTLLAWAGRCATPASAQVPQGWDTQTCRSLTYDIQVEMYHDGTRFRELDHRTLVITIGKGKIEIARTSSIEASSKKYGPFAFAVDGTMTPVAPDADPPPLEAEMLLHVLPAPPLNPSTSQWDVTDPPDARLEVSTVAIQQKTTYQTTGDRQVSGETIRDLSLESALRLVDNLATAALLGLPGQRSPQIQQVLDRLTQWGMFMFGTASWNVDRRMTTALDITYVAVPHAGGTRTSIAASHLRQHLTASLTQVQP